MRKSTNIIGTATVGYGLRMKINANLREGQSYPAIVNSVLADKPDLWPSVDAGCECLRRWQRREYKLWLQSEEANANALARVDAIEARYGKISEGVDARLVRSILLEAVTTIERDGSTSEKKATAILALTSALGAIAAGQREDVKLQQAATKIKQSEAKLDLDKRQQKLNEEKFCGVLLDKAKLALAEKIASANTPRAEKIAAMRQAFFADIEEFEKTEGKVVLPT